MEEDNLTLFIEKEFEHHSNNPFKNELGDALNCKWYRHRKNKNIRVVVFEDGQIYKTDSNGKKLLKKVISENDIT